jgi:hypothetical protein
MQARANGTETKTLDQQIEALGLGSTVTKQLVALPSAAEKEDWINLAKKGFKESAGEDVKEGGILPIAEQAAAAVSLPSWGGFVLKVLVNSALLLVGIVLMIAGLFVALKPSTPAGALA